jgi:hypothetical protein
MNSKEYYQANKERYIQYSRDYYAKHTFERQEYAQMHYQANKERRLAYQAEYYRKRKAANASYSKNGTPRVKPKKVKPVKPPKPEKKPRLIPEPRQTKYEFKDESFIVSLD